MKALIKTLIALVLICQAAFAFADERTNVEDRFFIQLKNEAGWANKTLPEFVEFANQIDTAVRIRARAQNFYCFTSIGKLDALHDGTLVLFSLNCFSVELKQNVDFDLEKLLNQINKDLGVKLYIDVEYGRARTGGATVHN
jgi:hypothetical protein